jgi:hypothetical protein
LLVPAAGGAVAAFLVVGVLVTDQALRFEGAEFGTVVLGLMWLGPWGLLVALPLLVVGGLGAGALSTLTPRRPSVSLALMFTLFLGGCTALAVSLLLPHLWWWSGIAALVLIAFTAVITAALTFPRSRALTAQLGSGSLGDEERQGSRIA